MTETTNIFPDFIRPACKPAAKPAAPASPELRAALELEALELFAESELLLAQAEALAERAARSAERIQKILEQE